MHAADNKTLGKIASSSSFSPIMFHQKNKQLQARIVNWYCEGHKKSATSRRLDFLIPNVVSEKSRDWVWSKQLGRVALVACSLNRCVIRGYHYIMA